ncbi:MAG: thiamine diphosphokinase [Lachnospiraceae bacterium]|nr:thiamine diphosphokinase [Lachnospiraceae bacterium]
MKKDIAKYGETVILVAGGTVDAALVRRVFDEATPPVLLIGVDRGTITILEAGLEPSRAIGDFDSVNAAQWERVHALPHVEKLIPEKDDTDTEHALRYAISLGPKKILMLGCTGTRLDQTISSIGLLKQATDAGIEAYILDANNRVRVVRDACTLRKKDAFGTYVSVLPYGDRLEHLYMKGFKYPAEDVSTDFSVSLTVSNELTAKEGEIRCDGYCIVIESKD